MIEEEKKDIRAQDLDEDRDQDKNELLNSTTTESVMD